MAISTSTFPYKASIILLYMMNLKLLPAHHSPEIRKLGWIRTSDRYKAYSAILAAEKYAQQLVDNASTIERNADRNFAMERGMDKLISARVAGRFFIEFEEQSALFESAPAETLVKSFLSAPQSHLDNQHDVVINGGRNLRDNLMRIFRMTTIPPYQPPFSYPSRPLFDSQGDMIEHLMSSTGDRCTSSQNKALARDGFRCIVTGVYDTISLMNCPDIADVSEARNVLIEVAHILSEPTVQGIEPEITDENEDSRVYNKTCHTASAISILKSFGFSGFVDTLGQTGEVGNLISLTHDNHYHFRRFSIWFEPTETPHRYRVCTLYKSYEEDIRDTFKGEDRQVEGAPMVVEFDSRYKDAPPPDPLLLALHALCARVAHASGAAEFFNHLGCGKGDPCFRRAVWSST